MMRVSSLCPIYIDEHLKTAEHWPCLMAMMNFCSIYTHFLYSKTSQFSPLTSSSANTRPTVWHQNNAEGLGKIYSRPTGWDQRHESLSQGFQSHLQTNRLWNPCEKGFGTPLVEGLSPCLSILIPARWSGVHSAKSLPTLHFFHSSETLQNADISFDFQGRRAALTRIPMPLSKWFHVLPQKSWWPWQNVLPYKSWRSWQHVLPYKSWKHCKTQPAVQAFHSLLSHSTTYWIVSRRIRDFWRYWQCSAQAYRQRIRLSKRLNPFYRTECPSCQDNQHKY